MSYIILVKMYSWEDIYKQYGIVQQKPLPCVQKLSSYLQKKRKLTILDVGCGTGRHIVYMRNQFPHSLIYGYDISQKGLDLAIKTLNLRNLFSSSTILFKHDIDTPFPYPDIAFDAVISTLVVHHGYRAEVIKRLNDTTALLKPGGYLAFATPSTKDPRYNTGKTSPDGTKLDTDQQDGNIPHYFFALDELKAVFTDYIILDIQEYHRPMVTSKGTAVNWEIVAQKK